MNDMADSSELQVRDRGPGAVLAAARVAQNLTVADVARQLKLSANQIMALEAGDFERLPGPVFVRGFVRNYARLLKVDPDRLLDMLGDAPGPQPKNDMPTARGVPFPTASVRRWPRYAVFALLLAIAGLAAYEFHWSDRLNVVTSSPPATDAATREVKQPSTSADAADTASKPVQAIVTEQPAAGHEPTARQPEAETAVAVPSLARSATGANELRFVIERDCWIQVRDADGRTLLTRLVHGGSEERVNGKAPFAVVVGRADAVRLYYNQQLVDLASHAVRDGVARLTLK
jgi:cytoskeleton protein RodZ